MRRAAAVLLAALAAGCPSGAVPGRYEPGVGRIRNLPGADKVRVGLVPFFDARWLARSSGYPDAGAVVAVVGGRPMRLQEDGRTAAVSDFVRRALFREFAAAGFFVEDLSELAAEGRADPKEILRAAEKYGDDYLVFGDVVAFDYAYVDRGPGSVWGADVSLLLNVLSLRTKRLLVRERVEDSWRGDPTDEGVEEGAIFGEEVIERRLVNYALRRTLARAADRVARAVAEDRGAPLERVEYEGGAPPDAAPPLPAEAPEASRAERRYEGAPGTLRVESDPPGARVTLGDRDLGPAPAETTAPPGAALDLLVQAPGRRPLLETIRMPGLRGLAVKVFLAPAPE